jgi:hypothetical protein
MQRMKIMLLGLLAVMALSSVAASTASAALQGGPWWRHPETKGSQKQVKWPMNEEKEIKSENEGSFILKGKLLGEKAILECRKVTNSGNIWNGAFQGEDEATVLFEECSIVEPKGCAGQAIIISPANVYTELQWKYGGNQNEIKEVGQQKIFDVFAPQEAPKQNEKNEARAIYVTIKIPTTCLGGLTANVEAAGTTALFTDAHQTTHKIIWGTAAQVEPQNQDATTGFLTWKLPNPTEFHHQETQTKAKLIFAGTPAELEGKIKVERSGVGAPEEFGAYNE